MPGHAHVMAPNQVAETSLNSSAVMAIRQSSPFISASNSKEKLLKVNPNFFVHTIKP
jgi:hypothetical protein